jgi:hypothetical protein
MITVRMDQSNLSLELAFPFEIVRIVDGDVNSPHVGVDVERTAWLWERQRLV